MKKQLLERDKKIKGLTIDIELLESKLQSKDSQMQGFKQKLVNSEKLQKSASEQYKTVQKELQKVNQENTNLKIELKSMQVDLIKKQDHIIKHQMQNSSFEISQMRPLSSHRQSLNLANNQAIMNLNNDDIQAGTLTYDQLLTIQEKNVQRPQNLRS